MTLDALDIRHEERDGRGRETSTKITPTCPYAKAQFDEDASIRDVLEG